MSGVDVTTFPKFTPFTKAWHTEPYPFISPTRPELSAAGRNIVVTGGGAGIGNAIAVAFATAGAKSVTIIGRRLEKLRTGAASVRAAVPENAETQVFYEQADLLSHDDTTRAFAAIAGKVGGKIHVLVSNAGPVSEGGATPASRLISDATDEQLVGSFRGIVLTAIHAMQAFLPLAGPNPVLLSTNTCFAHWPAIPNFGLYSCGRAALLKFTDYIQAENPHVRIVSVQPGWVATEGNGFQKEATDSGNCPRSYVKARPPRVH